MSLSQLLTWPWSKIVEAFVATVRFLSWLLKYVLPFLKRPSIRESKLAEFLHQGVNHCVRDCIWEMQAVVDGIGSPSKNVKDPLAEIDKIAISCLQNICDKVGDFARERTKKTCHVSIGVICTSEELQDSSIYEEMEKRAKSSLGGGARIGKIREHIAKKAGGSGEEFEPRVNGADPELVVVTRVRSKTCPEDRKKSSAPFWFIKASSAHRYFLEAENNQDGGVYCPPYDLDLGAVKNQEKLGKRYGKLFYCPRSHFAKYYRSVANFPVRSSAFENGRTAFVAFLWIDSQSPRAFRDTWEDVDVARSTWPATMNAIHAVCDAIATMLCAERLSRAMVRSSQELLSLRPRVTTSVPGSPSATIETPADEGKPNPAAQESDLPELGESGVEAQSATRAEHEG